MLARMWRKRNTPPLLVGLQACATTLEISLAVPQKIGHSTTGGSCHTFLGIYPEDVPTSKKDTCSTMFIAALFTILENLIYSVHRSDQNVTSQACRTTEPKRDHMLGRTVLGKGYKQNRMATPMGETKH
jgi:hypothetical protein